MFLRMVCSSNASKMAFDEVFHIVAMFKERFAFTLTSMEDLGGGGAQTRISFLFSDMQRLTFEFVPGEFFPDRAKAITVRCTYEVPDCEMDWFAERVEWIKKEMEGIRHEV